MTNAARSTTKGRAKARSRSIDDARKGINTSNKAGAALIPADKPLTDVQRLFVKFWARGESPASAASRCDIETSYAYRLIYMPNILAAYQAEKELYERDSGMNRKRVVDGFLEAIEMARTMAEPSTMVAGWREVAKMCGYYEPMQIKHTHTHEGKVQMEKLDRMSEDELMQEIARQAAIMAAGQQPHPQLEGALHDDLDENDGGAPP